jgi:hypothetical protein
MIEEVLSEENIIEEVLLHYYGIDCGSLRLYILHQIDNLEEKTKTFWVGANSVRSPHENLNGSS